MLRFMERLHIGNVTMAAQNLPTAFLIMGSEGSANNNSKVLAAASQKEDMVEETSPSDTPSCLQLKEETSGRTLSTNHGDDESSLRGPSLSTNDGEELAHNVSSRWTKMIQRNQRPLNAALLGMATFSAKRPWTTIVTTTSTVLLLLVLGLLTNFEIVVDDNRLWTPETSDTRMHKKWINNADLFPKPPRNLILFFHANGDSVLGDDNMLRVFEALDSIRELPEYNEVCESGIDTAASDCQIMGVTNFWHDSTTQLREAVDSGGMSTTETLSHLLFPSGQPVPKEQIFGYPVRSNATTYFTSIQSYTVLLSHPSAKKSKSWEGNAIDTILALNEEWAEDPSNPLRVEVYSHGAMGREFLRAITEDLVLIPYTFVLMTIFTALTISGVWVRRGVPFRGILGFAAVGSVILSVAGGFGYLFIIGIPFTPITQLAPFVMFGVGLDDAFILMGAYNRLDRLNDPVERVVAAVNEVAMSLALTTVTSSLAFALGCASSVPAVYWLSMFTAPTILLVLFFQLTFFVACIVLDERRIQESEMLITCFAKKFEEQETENVPATCEAGVSPLNNDHESSNFKEGGISKWYACQLLKPTTRAVVILVFLGLTLACGMSASHLRQEFDVSDVLPADSYIKRFLDAFETYRKGNVLRSTVYFRDVDQSQPSVQTQMKDFLHDLVARVDSIPQEPDYFWLDHLRLNSKLTGLSNEPFSVQLDSFLSNPIFHQLHRNNIALNDNGQIIASRVNIDILVDATNVESQVETLHAQKAVAMSQSINQGRRREDLAFFLYEGTFNIWEFFAVVQSELLLVTVVGIASVSIVSLALIPHWSAVVYILPMVVVLYVDLLGIMQWIGIKVNAVSFVTLAMSIGLLVDFIVHTLFRYHEESGNRVARVTKVLRTMGPSILLGGVTTLLGTLPLMFCSSSVFQIVFKTFVGIVTLGLAHGLILLPILLATFGPEDNLVSTITN